MTGSGTTGSGSATGSTSGEVGTTTPAGCDDAAQNGDETDVDCGGSCPACPDGSGCDGDDDCASMSCVEGTCVTPVCVDDDDCAEWTGACTVGGCVRGACAALPVEDGSDCDDLQVCTAGPAACSAGVCVDSDGPGGIIQLSDVALGIGGYVIDSNLYTGHEITMIPDFNGDGFADIAVGDPSYNNGTKGRVWIMLGKPDGAPMSYADLMAEQGGFYLDGVAEFHSLGRSLRSGDLNNDGRGDLVVGSDSSDTYRVRVFYGALNYGVISLNSADVRLKNPNGNNSLGSRLTVADVNGDGLDDFVTANNTYSPQGKQAAGRTYVVFSGQTTTVDINDITAGAGGFIIDGTAPNELTGASLSAAGDVNGDGYEDIIVAAGGNDTPRPSYVVFGKADGSPVQLADVAAGDGGFVVYPETELALLESAAAGDVDGDGFADLVFGDYLYEGDNVANAGRGYVVFGRPDWDPTVQLADIAAGDGGFIITGFAPSDRAGRGVSTAGDQNHDGLSDIYLTTNPGADLGLVVFGKQDSLPVYKTDVVAGHGGYAIHGKNYRYQNAGGQDVNGDGTADVVALAQKVDSDVIQSVYVVFGGDCDL